MSDFWEKAKDNWPLFTILLLLVIALLAVFFLRRGNLDISDTDKRESVTVMQNGEQITVFRSGRVVRKAADGTETEEFWSSQKTAAFFDYYWEIYGQGEDVVSISVGGEGGFPINAEDELSDVILDDDSGDGGGGGLDDYFSTPSPTNPGGGGASPTTPPGGGGGGGGSTEPECLFWRLSYCVTFPTPTPAVPTPTPVDTTFFEPTCEDVGNQQTGKTVIGDELCIIEPDEELSY